MRRVYADHAATTRVHPEVAQAMLQALNEDFGNPSSLHAYGRSGRKAVEMAREQVAVLIGARPAELFFTSGGTEADNWALRGVAWANRARGNHIITTAVEHHAVLDCADALEREGFSVTRLPVAPGTGYVDPAAVVAALRPETILVSVMLVNNEIGTVMDVGAVCAAVKAAAPGVVVHTDAVQAVGSMPVNVHDLGVDLLSLSAHKIYGPKGVGALYVRKGFRFTGLLQGGGQERRLRPGTENVPGIIGFGKAAELARRELAGRIEHARTLRDRFARGVLAQIPGVTVNGPDPFTAGDHRQPGNLNICVENVFAETMLLRLDMKGVACSAGSACTAGATEPSHVVLAVGVPTELAHTSLRFSFGQANTEDDIDYLLAVFPEVVRSLRAMSPSYTGGEA